MVHRLQDADLGPDSGRSRWSLYAISGQRDQWEAFGTPVGPIFAMRPDLTSDDEQPVTVVFRGYAARRSSTTGRCFRPSR